MLAKQLFFAAGSRSVPKSIGTLGTLLNNDRLHHISLEVTLRDDLVAVRDVGAKQPPHASDERGDQSSSHRSEVRCPNR